MQPALQYSQQLLLATLRQGGLPDGLRVGKPGELYTFDVIRIVAKGVPDDGIPAKDFLVEIGHGAQVVAFEEAEVVGRLKALYVDADVRQQLQYDLVSVARLDQRL